MYTEYGYFQHCRQICNGQPSFWDSFLTGSAPEQPEPRASLRGRPGALSTLPCRILLVFFSPYGALPWVT
ncbi:MAG: hypothetical protein CSA32_03715 [Desulfobulbus propionicus]|nr:MAG: hypothetical protein CSA32_03715 [Desulfobulbus propionicus]